METGLKMDSNTVRISDLVQERLLVRINI